MRKHFCEDYRHHRERHYHHHQQHRLPCTDIPASKPKAAPSAPTCQLEEFQLSGLPGSPAWSAGCRAPSNMSQQRYSRVPEDIKTHFPEIDPEGLGSSGEASGSWLQLPFVALNLQGERFRIKPGHQKHTKS